MIYASLRSKKVERFTPIPRLAAKKSNVVQELRGAGASLTFEVLRAVGEVRVRRHSLTGGKRRAVERETRGRYYHLY